ncbi:MAG TPA: amino acid adenylation domain-containing protein, partial [Longimicrobium sp.]|nr:amino acid adenylation domain-containing protein [Longimicrobium sp.]
VGDTVRGADRHRHLPFELLLEEAGAPRDAARHPLFQTLFVLQRATAHAVPGTDSGITLRPVEVDNHTSKLDLSFLVDDDGSALTVLITYDTELFDAATIDRLAAHYARLLATAVRAPGTRLHALPPTERGAAEAGCVAPIDRGPTVAERFAVAAGRTPGRVAVEDGRERLTFAALDARANRLAHELRARGAGPETRVAILLERSGHAVAAILGAWKTGAAYVPLDPAWPAARVGRVLERAGAAVVVTRDTLRGALPAGVPVVSVDGDADRLAAHPAEAPGPLPAPESLAYVIFTSGTTGTPRGVAVEHRNLAAYVRDAAARLGLEEGDRFGLVSTLAADLGHTMLFPTLALGGTLRLFDTELAGDAAALAGEVRHEPVDHLKITPSHLAALLAEPGGDAILPRRSLVLGGEVSRTAWVRQLQARAPGMRIRNHYGPTETTVGAATHAFQADDPTLGDTLPLGTPLAGARLSVRGPTGAPLPDGVPGELCIGGEGVARGYLGCPALTAGRFVPDPGAALPGARMYRTGDRARRRPDGVFEFLGRLDEQVKIRGFRVEPAEVEAVLREHPALRQCAVRARHDAGGGARLAAFTVAAADPAPDAAALRAWLRQRLPEAMVPAHFVALHSLPLTPNGKVDGAALAELVRGAAPEGAHRAPGTPAERALARIWEEVLNAGRVGADDDYFALGGDSLLAIQVVARARRAGLHLRPRMLFEHPTVAALARAAESGAAVNAEQGEVVGEVPLTAIQQWFFAQELPAPHHWNMPMLLETREALDGALLGRALGVLLAHHDALRMRYRRRGAGWEQHVAPIAESPPVLECFDLSHLRGAGFTAEVERIATRVQGALELEGGPVFRAACFHAGPGRPGRLLLAAHHLVMDGVSWRVLLEDLEAAYRALARGEPAALAPKTTSFREWAGRIRTHAASGALDADAAFWSLPAGTPIPRLPVDRPAGAGTEAKAGHLSGELTAAETRALLAEVPAALGVRVMDVLMAALGRTLAEWAGVEAALVDVEGHGREELVAGVDLSRTVGWFTALFPVLLDLRGADGPEGALRVARSRLRELPSHGLAHGVLRALGVGRAAERVRAFPRAEVVFNYLGRVDGSPGGDSLLALSGDPMGPPYHPDTPRAHLLEIHAIVVEGTFRTGWAYATAAHDAATVERWMARFLAELRALVALARAVPPGGPAVVPLSAGQRRLWLVEQAEPESPAYNMSFSVRLRGALDEDALGRALSEVVARHAVLRATVDVGPGGLPVQSIHPPRPVPLAITDVRHLLPAAGEARAFAEAAREAAQPFDLARGPVLRARVVRLADDDRVAVLTLHHIAADAWSMDVLASELSALYAAFVAGRPSPLRPLPAGYADFAAREAERLASPATAEHLAYWRARLEGATGLRGLGDRPDVPEPGVTRVLTRPVPASAVATLVALCRRQSATPFMGYLALFAALLGRWTGERDLVVGAPFTNREHEEFHGVIGFFVDLLPLRVEVGQGGLDALLRHVRERVAEARAHQDVPFDLIVRELRALHGAEAASLVRVSFTTRPAAPGTVLELPGIHAQPFASADHLARFDLEMVVDHEDGGAALVNLTYDTARFHAATIDRLLDEYVALAECLPGDPARCVLGPPAGETCGVLAPA